MPSNPFGKKDPLAGSHGTQGSGAWGTGPAGFGSAYADGAAANTEEYDVVDMTNDAPAGQSARGTQSGRFKSSFKPDKNASTAAREAELQRWQADLERRERAQGNSSQGNGNQRNNIDAVKNFPPCLPVAHHNISKDIPAGRKSITRMAFLIWLFTLVALLYGCVAIIICNIVSNRVDTSAPNIVWAVMVVIIGVPVSWLLWYKRFYKGMINDGAFSFCLFFCVFLIHIAWCVFAAVSPPIGGDIPAGSNTYTTGFMNTIEFSQGNGGGDKLATILCAVGASWWAVVAVISFIFLIRSYKYFRGRTIDEEAQKDATSQRV